jgi:ribosomal protein S18 acetylase RimI-like enzyme
VTEATATESLPGQDTLVACWRADASRSPGAQVTQSDSVVVASFPAFAPMNNAIVLRAYEVDLGIEAARLRRAYAQAAVPSWALWIPSCSTTFDADDEITAIDGMQRDETTLVMRLETLPTGRTDPRVRRSSFAAACRAGDEPIPADDLGEPDPDDRLASWVMVDGKVGIAGAQSFLLGADCGIYAVGTAPAWRRSGIARRLVEHVLTDAARRGARTATLQSTPMGQGLYESIGFYAVGRYEEWVPQ